MRLGSAPSTIRWATRCANVLVLPEPARQTEAADFGQPTASVTRWRVSVLPSSPLPVPGRPLATRTDPVPRRREC